jgi:hypothetical protein
VLQLEVLVLQGKVKTPADNVSAVRVKQQSGFTQVAGALCFTLCLKFWSLSVYLKLSSCKCLF